MLSPSARPLIAASVPVLRQHGAAITQRFYTDLFEAEPALTNLFNMGNQASGAQQGALAAALFAYAANIDDAAALAPVIERIAHKHASLGIKPAQYWTVGRFLLGAIQKVLGEAATPALLLAWDEAYWLLASTLIAAEATLYARSGKPAGQTQQLVVSALRRESADTMSYCLQTADGQSPGPFLPGQYVTVTVDVPALGIRQPRQYSLSDSPDKPHWRITVKREAGGALAPDGLVSNLLHAQLQVGSTLEVGQPFGDFTPSLESGRPQVFLSAGVGVTPMIGVLKALAERAHGGPILFAQAARSGDDLLFQDEVAQLRARLPKLTSLAFCESDQGATVAAARIGRLALSAEELRAYDDADFYLCGPLPFLRAQWQALVEHGISANRIQREVFGPDLLEHLIDD